MAVEFRLLPLRFTLIASSTLRFEAGMAGNIVRGALGSVADKRHPLYASFYRSKTSVPFVLRVRHLDGRIIPAGAEFEVGINLFSLDGCDYLTETGS